MCQGQRLKKNEVLVRTGFTRYETAAAADSLGKKKNGIYAVLRRMKTGFNPI